MKKVCALLGLIVAGALPVHARSSGEYSLIVAPARYSVMQVMFDVIDQRPSVLVSYQGEATTENPALHVWNGSVWNPLAVHDLQELSFLQRTPTRAILVGDDSLIPVSVRDSLAWLPEVVYVRELGTSALLNDFGRLFKWSGREWRWFAKRYNLDLEDEAALARQQSWYDQPGPKPRPSKKEYAPAPAATIPGAYIEPPAMTQPQPLPAPPPALERPTDLPAPAPVIEPAPVVESPAQPARSEIDALIETLEQERAVKPGPPAVESFPIK